MSQALRDVRSPGWQAQAFVSNLTWASKGLGLGMDEHANAIEGLYAFVGRGEGLKARQSQQSTFYALLQTFTPPQWDITLNRKLRGFDCLYGNVVLTSDDIFKIVPALRRLGPRIVMGVVKTWLTPGHFSSYARGL